MKEVEQYRKTGIILLCVTIILWILALLFLFRIINIFDRYLMKFPGPFVVFGMMSIFPLAIIYVGMKTNKARQDSRGGWGFILSGGLLFLAFVGVIGVPMLQDAITPGPPENPTTPRPVEPQGGLPVFPGAEGFGTQTIAGRGGKVIEVTSLEDDGPGSLRSALNDTSPRVIVFRIGGIIELNQDLYINHPFVTIAGQTAPGDGITIKNGGVVITTHDVLIQHIRVRPGNQGSGDPDNNDAIQILGMAGDFEGAYNVVLDHISASWGEDETISTWFGAHDITISWSIISEALNRSRHRKETHSAGLLIGDSSYHVSVHHNLFAHNDFRNPAISGGGTHDFVNNVIYNWGVLPSTISDDNSNTFLNFVGNHFIPGPSTVAGPFEILFSEGNPRIYVEGNLGPNRPDQNLDEWSLVGIGYGEDGVAPELYRSLTRYSAPAITTGSAIWALENVLLDAGATAPRRDMIDLRIVSEVMERGGSIIDSPDDVGGYPNLVSGEPPPDSDHDGMPDDWELEMGFDPDDPVDGNGDIDNDGYTNLEEYLHFLSNGRQ
jgi:pectate lyase